jgi:hypothetical protein
MKILTKTLASVAFAGVVAVPVMTSSVYGQSNPQPPFYQDGKDCDPNIQAGTTERYAEACLTKSIQELKAMGVSDNYLELSMISLPKYASGERPDHPKWNQAGAKKVWSIISNKAYRKNPATDKSVPYQRESTRPK